MLVRVHYKSGTNPERLLAERLRRWRNKSAPDGIATINCSLFSRGRLYHLDTVIWTPGGCIVVEAEGFAHHQVGSLEIPFNGQWMIAGQPAHFLRHDENTPLDHSREHTSALQTWLADQRLGQRVVRGAVVLVPFDGAKIVLHQLWSDPSFAVLLADNDEALRGYVDAVGQSELEGWTANDIAIAFRGMGLLNQLPSPQELLNEGFLGPVDPKLWQGGPLEVAPAPVPVTAAGPAAGPASMPVAAGITQWVYSPWRIYPRVPDDPHFGRAVLRTVLASGMLLSLVWVMWTGYRLVLAIGML